MTWPSKRRGKLTRKERAHDSFYSYEEGIKALREQHIRRHAIEPRQNNAEEMGWWNEGELPKGEARK